MPILFVPAASVFVNPGVDLHLLSGANLAVDSAVDLSASFWNDIDQQSRLGLTWDRGADERGAPTAVELISFAARGLDGAVELTWETATELQNLGFHLYRASSPEGPFERITGQIIPGLGSSPSGARYRYLDSGLENGRLYYYELEDVESLGGTKRHGPVEATPSAAAGSGVASPAITFGEPAPGAIEIRPVREGLEIELWTPGFFAEPLGDGTVRIEIPGLDGSPLPFSRPYVPISGRTARIVSVQELETTRIAGLTPGGAAPEVSTSRQGVVRIRARNRSGREPAATRSAKVLGIAYQGSQRKAQLELAPLRVDPATSELVLVRRLVVRLAVEGREPKPASSRRRGARREILSEIVTREPGLYAVPFEKIFPRGRGIPASSLALSRLGESVPFAVEPGRLLFWSDGEKANPYGKEAVYRLERGGGSQLSIEKRAAGEGGLYRHRLEREENRYYQAALLDAPDLWLWDLLIAPQRKSFSFTVDSLAQSAGPARIEVWLQGTSDFPTENDHHVRAYVNGAYLGESAWNGKAAQSLELEVPDGILIEGANALELESVGGDAPYSMVMLDRFAVSYWKSPPAEAHYAVAGQLVSESGVREPELRAFRSILIRPGAGISWSARGISSDRASSPRLRQAQGFRRAVAIEDVYSSSAAEAASGAPEFSSACLPRLAATQDSLRAPPRGCNVRLQGLFRDRRPEPGPAVDCKNLVSLDSFGSWLRRGERRGRPARCRSRTASSGEPLRAFRDGRQDPPLRGGVFRPGDAITSWPTIPTTPAISRRTLDSSRTACSRGSRSKRST
jgi:hypothetical protein